MEVLLQLYVTCRWINMCCTRCLQKTAEWILIANIIEHIQGIFLSGFVVSRSSIKLGFLFAALSSLSISGEKTISTRKKKRAKIYSFLSQCRRTLRFVFESWLALLCEGKSVSAGFDRDKGKFSVESIEFANQTNLFLSFFLQSFSFFFLLINF